MNEAFNLSGPSFLTFMRIMVVKYDTYTGNDLCQNVRTGFTHLSGPSCSERAWFQDVQLLTKGANRVIAGGSCYALLSHVYLEFTRLFQERDLITQMSLCSYFCFHDTNI